MTRRVIISHKNLTEKSPPTMLEKYTMKIKGDTTMNTLSSLSKKHRIFVEAFDGDNVILAMRTAGFDGVDAYLKQKGNELLKQPLIVEAVKQRTLYTNSLTKTIATREERQAFWTNIMRNSDPDAQPILDANNMTKPPENIPLATRLKASELLGKSEADFMEKLDIHSTLSITDVINKSYAIDDLTLEQIEEQYEKQRLIKKERENTFEVTPEGEILQPDLEDFI